MGNKAHKIVPKIVLYTPNFKHPMPPTTPILKIENATIQTQANVYFGGKCVSHTLYLADGTRKSVGVILPSTLQFTTGAAEVMECVAGRCEYQLQAEGLWQSCELGQQFAIAKDAEFQVRVAEGQAFHYICHFVG
jgi:uncharacterized protein YaiE (UPF0345 family)